jgi:tetratricopeptide (TPR) repeat protein
MLVEPGNMKKPGPKAGILQRLTLAVLVWALFFAAAAFAQRQPRDGWQTEFRSGTAIVNKLANLETQLTGKETIYDLALGEAREAEQHLRKALAQARSVGAGKSVLANILYDLARSLTWQGNYAEAKKFIFEAKQIRERVNGSGSLPALDCKLLLAVLLENSRYTEDLMIDVYEGYLALLPHDDSRFAQVLPFLGAHTQDPVEAVEYYGHLVEVDEKRFGEYSPRLVSPLELYAAALANTRRHAESARIYERALQICQANPGKVTANNCKEQMTAERRRAAGELPDFINDKLYPVGRRSERRLKGIKTTVVPPEDVLLSALQKYGLYDNMSLDRALANAEALMLNNAAAAKKEWTRVLNCIHSPDWHATAAAVTVSLRFARLADVCMNQGNYTDADELLRGAFDFPFMRRQDYEVIDAAVSKLVSHYMQAGKRDECRNFLIHAMERVEGPRLSKYRTWLTDTESLSGE